MNNRAALLILALFIIIGGMPDAGAGAPVIDEWNVPWKNSRPRDPWLYQGKVWFVGQVGDYVATLDPQSGKFYRYPLPGGTGPHTVIVDRTPIQVNPTEASPRSKLEL